MSPIARSALETLHESPGSAASMNCAPIRILLVSEPKEARRLEGLLDSDRNRQFLLAHVPGLEYAAEWLSSEPVDVLLVDLGGKHREGRAFVQAARAAAPETPMVVLAEFDDDQLALDALRQGAQDFLSKEHLDHATLARSLRFSIERHLLQKNLQNLSLIDDLTGLHNRRGFLALAEQHLRVIQRKGAALLVYVDLDDLKVINDNYGHLEGNRALVVTASVLRSCFRQSDILARIGGDEFCVLMTDAVQDTAQQVRKRLQQRTDLINTLSSWRFRLSLSVGIAEVPVLQHPSLDDLLRTADGRMYLEKRQKRLHGPDSPALKHNALVIHS